MSEWIRHRGSKSMPKCLEGKRFEVRLRNGNIHDQAPCNDWENDGSGLDVMAYRILGDINPPDYSKGFPVGTTANSIGAKVGDKFMVVDSSGGFKNGELITLIEDDGDEVPYFRNSVGDEHYMNFRELAPIQPKTAIELQAEELGIPEPVRLVDDDVHLGIKRPDGDGWVKYNAGDVVDLDGVVSIDWVDADGGKDTMPWPPAFRWADGEHDQIAWYRLNYGDASQHYDADSTKHVTPAAVNVMVDLGVESPTTAPEFLQSALNTLTQRGKDYDKPEGERSAAAVAVAFNAITGRNLTEAEVWLVLQLVKDVRQWQNPERYHADSALDCVAYAALKAEALARK